MRDRRRLRGKIVDTDQPVRPKKHGSADNRENQVVDSQQEPCIMHGLLRLPRSHALPHYGDQPQAQGISRKVQKRYQVAGHRIACDRGRSQGGNQALEKYFSKLKHAALQSAGDADGENGADHPWMGAQRPYFAYAERIVAVLKQYQYEHCRCHAADQSGIGHACHTHL